MQCGLCGFLIIKPQTTQHHAVRCTVTCGAMQLCHFVGSFGAVFCGLCGLCGLVNTPSSNLTFGGYSVGTTPMLFARSSFFLVQALFRVCKFHVAHWWYLQHHQLVPFVGNKIVAIPEQRVAWYLLNQWQSPTTFRRTNREQLLSRDKCRL